MIRIFGMIALLAACTCGSGCAAGTGAKDKRPAKEQPTTQPSKPVARSESYAAPVVVQAPVPAKPVREGKALLVYLLPAGGTVRIVDKTSDVELATASAEAQSIIRIDELTGITLGRNTLLRGPLPAGHEYAIYLSTGSANDVQRSVSSPGR